MKIKKNNAFAIIMVLVLLAALFMSMYSILPVHGKIYNMFMNESEFSGYVTQETCEDNDGTWENGICQPLSTRAMNVIDHNRTTWLVAPFIFVVGLIFWMITIGLKQDPQEFYLR